MIRVADPRRFSMAHDVDGYVLPVPKFPRQRMPYGGFQTIVEA